MMSMVTILFCLISRDEIINKPIQYETGKDTLYYLVFLDLMERTTNEKDKYEIKDSNLTNENRDIAKQIKHELAKPFIALSADSCWKKVLVDSVTRREEKLLIEYCDQCGIGNRLVIVDASWIYLSEPDFKSLELQNRSRFNGIVSSTTDIVGTWWTIRVLIFDPKQKKVIYNHVDRYTQYDNVKPMRKFPGIGHRRFFNRSLKKAKQFLVTHKE